MLSVLGTLPEVLARLAEKEPGRFCGPNESGYAHVLLSKWWFELDFERTLPEFVAERLALLAAALLELIEANGWGYTVDRSYLGLDIDIYPYWDGNDAAPHRIGRAESTTDAFALVLARAVLSALEATGPCGPAARAEGKP